MSEANSEAKAVLAALEEAYAPSKADEVRSWQRITDWRKSGGEVASDRVVRTSGKIFRPEPKTRAFRSPFLLGGSLAAAVVVMAAVFLRSSVNPWIQTGKGSLTDGTIVQPSEVAYTLQPVDRGGAGKYQRIAAEKTVALRLVVDGPASSDKYEAVVEDENSHSVFMATDLTKSFISGTWTVDVRLPGSTLRPGDYVLSLNRISDGQKIHVNDYAFAIQR